MSQKFLVDSDILIDFFCGYEKAISFINDHAEQIVLSAVVVAELYAGVKGEREKSMLNQFVSLFPVLPLNQEIAVTGGLYKSTYGKSHGIGLMDGIIAATAQHAQAELKTLNMQHYPMVQGLKPAYRKKRA